MTFVTERAGSQNGHTPGEGARDGLLSSERNKDDSIRPLPYNRYSSDQWSYANEVAIINIKAKKRKKKKRKTKKLSNTE